MLDLPVGRRDVEVLGRVASVSPALLLDLPGGRGRSAKSPSVASLHALYDILTIQSETADNFNLLTLLGVAKLTSTSSIQTGDYGP